MVGLNYLELEQQAQTKVNRVIVTGLAFTVCLVFVSFVELLTWSKQSQAKEAQFDDRVMQLEQEIRDLKTERYIQKAKEKTLLEESAVVAMPTINNSKKNAK